MVAQVPKFSMRYLVEQTIFFVLLTILSLTLPKCRSLITPYVLTVSKNSWTPLHWAAWHGHEPIVEQLIEMGADKEARDDVSLK